MRWLNGELILLYSVVMHWLNIVHLQHELRSLTDQPWSVSMWNYTYVYGMDEWRTNFTVFCCNPLAKCCTTAS
jgi:hypothetical protein